ncbi:hypothetical protein ES703_85891 [subsurface metagenome]
MPAPVEAAAVGELWPVQAEVQIASGLPTTTIVGLPDTAVQEARERVRARDLWGEKEEILEHEELDARVPQRISARQAEAKSLIFGKGGN